MKGLIAALTLLPSLSWATPMVMTFEGVTHDPYASSPWVENGITATGSIGYWTNPGTAHLDRIGSPYATRLDFTTGGLFIPQSIELLAHGSEYCSSEPCFGGINGEPPSTFDDPIPYIWFNGYLNDQLVGSLSLFRPASSVFELISLSALGTIDRLTIEVRNYMDLGLPGWCVGNCGEFDIDNLVVNSVPEPEALSLLALGLAGMLIARRRQRSAVKMRDTQAH